MGLLMFELPGPGSNEKRTSTSDDMQYIVIAKACRHGGIDALLQLAYYLIGT